MSKQHRTFKAGDRVRVTGKATFDKDKWCGYWNPSMDYAVGREYTVLGFNADSQDYQLTTVSDSGMEMNFWFPPCVLEHVIHTPAPPVFKCGDRVKFLTRSRMGCGPYWIGQYGFIDRIEPFMGVPVYHAYLEGRKADGCNSYFAEHLELAPMDATSNTKFVVVKVTFDDDTRHFKKSYDYKCLAGLLPRPGDVLTVDTPYGNNKRVIVMSVGPYNPREAWHFSLKQVKGVVQRKKRDVGVRKDFYQQAIYGKSSALLDGIMIHKAIHDEILLMDFKTSSTDNPKETAMTPLKIETKLLLTGGSLGTSRVDVKDVSDDHAFGYIREAENEINNLNAIQNKPASLTKRINDLQAGIDALVKLVDERSAKDSAKDSGSTASA